MSDGPGLEAGSFVWTMFPFGPPDPPHRPGPSRHIGYVLARTGDATALVAYTSSGRWRDDQLPLGVIEFDQQAADALGQRPFHLDLRCLARMPFTSAWFPELDRPGRGVQAVAGQRLRSRIQGQLDALVRRSPEILQLRGPR